MGIDLRKAFVVLAVVAMAGVLYFAGFSSRTGGRTSAASVYAARLSPQLTSQVAGLGDAASVGVVIVSFNTSSGLTPANLDILRGVGVSSAVTFNKLGMVGAVLTAGQVKALAANPAVRSIWSNDRLQYYINAARTVTGVDKVRTDASMTLKNGGMPVSGDGNFSVMVIDTGIDATTADLPYGTKVIQNTQRSSPPIRATPASLSAAFRSTASRLRFRSRTSPTQTTSGTGRTARASSAASARVRAGLTRALRRA